MEMYGYQVIRKSDLMHHGIKGQKWGIRRYQNEDGSWTSAGRERYGAGTGSIGGSVHRALADVYGLNERYYSKRGNKLAASMNSDARKKQLEKARTSDKAKADKIINRLNEKYKRKNQEFDDYSKMILDARKKNREKLLKKSEKAANKNAKASDKVKDFDLGTKYVKAGQDKVKKALNKYQGLQVKAVMDKSVKNSAEYKQAKKEYYKIIKNGPAVSSLAYAFAATDQEPKKK